MVVVVVRYRVLFECLDDPRRERISTGSRSLTLRETKRRSCVENSKARGVDKCCGEGDRRL